MIVAVKFNMLPEKYNHTGCPILSLHVLFFFFGVGGAGFVQGSCFVFVCHEDIYLCDNTFKWRNTGSNTMLPVRIMGTFTLKKMHKKRLKQIRVVEGWRNKKNLHGD